METGKLKTFAQAARRKLLEDVATRLEQVLRADSVETREKKAAITELRQQIALSNKPAVIDRVAYTWFNRFCALRFMDVNHYTRLGIVSPLEGYTQPEILQEAKQGVIDAELKVDRQRVLDILSGKMPSSDPQGEAYRLLLVAVCNAYNAVMPFMFEKIADYTELLMPLDQLSEHSVLHALRQAMTVDNCQDVEIIGWLYQFYISERKDEVFENLKKNIKIEAKDIPAATQLFTPHWIVRYLVENSLGRLWMLNYPDSRLVEQMDYYIRPVQEETDFLKIKSPEEIKVCDSACGSGHMLTYAFDLLYAIYTECGYDPVEIPRLILEKNLFGIEIDPRAGALAAFALFMKARAKDRRFFSRPVQPNICVLENVTFTASEIDEYMQVVGRNLFTQDLWVTLRQFEQADNFGSLIRPAVSEVDYVRSMLEVKNLGGNLFLYGVHQRVLKVLQQAEYLAPRYHVVVANPPYMGSKGMNDELKKFAIDHYPESKSDLFAMFIVGNMGLVFHCGMVGMITMHNWMFISSYENLRKKILSDETIISMAHLGPRAFNSISGEVVSTTAFVVHHITNIKHKGYYIRLTDGGNENEKEMLLRNNIPTNINPLPENCFLSSAIDFKKIPGMPISYWVDEKVRLIFDTYSSIGEISKIRAGMATGDNDRFVRFWHEVGKKSLKLDASSADEVWKNEDNKWVLFNKGGDIRKWYGNNLFVLTYNKTSYNALKISGNQCPSEEYYFRECLTWSDVTTGNFYIRYFQKGSVFSSVGNSIFEVETTPLSLICCLLASNIVSKWLGIINPTLHANPGDVAKLPFINPEKENITKNIFNSSIEISKFDWSSYETVWEFNKFQLLNIDYRTDNLSSSYNSLREYWRATTLKLRQLEEKNNGIFIEAYGLKEELTPDVPLEEITLTCNPYYRYGGKKSEEELEALLLADTIKEYISYAVGCMFGRYSLDKPGLILANHGETARDYYKQIQQPSFPPDEDNVLPILEAGWFSDDITERFKKFLRLTFSDEHYEENLAFIENAIGRDIRSYFLKDFYGEHVRMYKSRPIYWLFSSPNGSFNALIYMQRYRPDTVSVVLNDYLREYVRKLNAHKAHLEQVSLRMGGSQAEKTKATKEINALNKVLAELKEYEDEVLYPLATRQIQIDLDDGVKVNYSKFGKALKSVKGLSE